jgi:hypothetical protein
MRAKEFITGTKQFILTGVITNESIIEFIRKSAKTMNAKQRIYIIEHLAENEGKMINEVLDMRLASDIQQLLKSFTVEKAETNESASGYIPSKKQANDPRYKTGLTKDVRPDTIQKNAKAFGFKTSRAGIPPLLRK